MPPPVWKNGHPFETNLSGQVVRQLQNPQVEELLLATTFETLQAAMRTCSRMSSSYWQEPDGHN